MAASISPWRWYGAGVATGVFLSVMLYLATLPPGGEADLELAEQQAPGEKAPPRPRFDFYTLLPEQTIDVEMEPSRIATPRNVPVEPATESYLLQAGSFRQHEDAERRRAELLLLGLEPRVEEISGEHGRWFRVYLGPFETHAQMNRVRGLTAGQDIDTLLLRKDQR